MSTSRVHPCVRPVLRSTTWLLALMKSADPLPNQVIALERRSAPLGLADPRSRRFVITTQPTCYTRPTLDQRGRMIVRRRPRKLPRVS